MNEVFDLTNIILLGAAVIVFLCLRSVLGIRTGHQPPEDNSFGRDKSENRDSSNDNIIPLPGQKLPDDFAENREKHEQEEKPVEPIWTGIADEGSDLAKSLEKIAVSDPDFHPKEFIEGAKMAYEMIILSFAEADKKTLKPLLSKEVNTRFAGAIDERVKNGDVMETQIVGINSATLVDANLKGRKSQLTIEFSSDMITATRDRLGEVIDGDPKSVSEVNDIWTFEKDVKSNDPNWKLIATQAAE